MVNQCVVPFCNSKNGHSFPFSRPNILKQWINAVKRKNWKPSKNSVVCSKHFVDKDYVESTVYGKAPQRKTLKPDAVPSLFLWSQPSPSTERTKRLKRRQEIQSKEHSPNVYIDDILSVAVGAETEITLEPEVKEEVHCLIEKETQTEEIEVNTASAQTVSGIPGKSAFNYMFDDAGIHFYTGLESYSKFMMVFHLLGPAKYCLNYYSGWTPSLCVEDQFFLTLIKLRRHPTNFALSRDFLISEPAVSNIFITWINFLHCQLGEINWWPSRDLVKFYFPFDFAKKFPTTRLIVDGTECPIQKPKAPLNQRATFSSYKNLNTMKVLVGISPGGLVSYVSEAYGGSVSDRAIVERSPLLQMCDPGDTILADKGFNVQDLFISKNVGINMPHFFKKKNRISGADVKKDRKISSKRVHVERVIGLAKTYKILVSPLNSTETQLATAIIRVCFWFCNFRTNIISKDA